MGMTLRLNSMFNSQNNALSEDRDACERPVVVYGITPTFPDYKTFRVAFDYPDFSSEIFGRDPGQWSPLIERVRVVNAETFPHCES